MEKERKWAGWVILGVAAVLVVSIVAFSGTTSRSSAGTVPSQAEHTGLEQLFSQSGGDAGTFEKLQDSMGLNAVYAVRGADGVLGYAAIHTVQGYGGPIELALGLHADGVISGIQVGGEDFRETEGLGSKAREPAFVDQFAGQTPPLALGSEIDGIAGATVTSKAVVDGINEMSIRLHSLLPSMPSSPGLTANASVLGYGGPVLVRLTLSEEGVIQSVDIGGARFSETEGVGSRIREKSFTDSFIGKTPPLSLGSEIDAVAGATVSSQAAVDAVNEAAAFLAQ